MRFKFWQQWGLILISVLWTLLVTAGFWQLYVYANTPGEAAAAHSQWPLTTALGRDLDRATFLAFVHPYCPCSEATLGELERLMPQGKEKMQTWVVFYQPKDKSDEWVQGRLWKKAQAIPGVQVFLDRQGTEAKNFDARTSGQTFLYNRQGSLVFSGGITPQRGHMGDNLGRDSILAFLETGKTTRLTTPTFGCSLRNPERAVFAEKERHELTK